MMTLFRTKPFSLNLVVDNRGGRMRKLAHEPKELVNRNVDENEGH